MSIRSDLRTLANASLSENPEKPGEYILDLEFTTTYNGMTDANFQHHAYYSVDRATCLRTLEAISRPLGVPSLDRVLASLLRIETLLQERQSSS